MTILKHMCPKCEHSDECHTGQSCSYEWCRCNATEFDPEPTVCPTWDADQRPVLTVTPPGTRWPQTGRGFVTCSCDACHAKYAELIGATA